MNKTRVHELAQKMGIDNKELIAKFQAVGVDVTSHMAVVTEEDIAKLSPPSPTVKETSQEETRVKPTVIRRRPKIVDEPVAVAAEEPVAPVSTLAPTEEKTVEHVETTPKEQPPVLSATSAEVVKADEKEVPPPIAVQPEPEKHVPGRARILGRIEIPIPKPRQPQRTQERPSAPRPPKVIEKETPVAVPQEPSAAVEDRKKGRKGKETPVVDMDRAPKKVAAAGKKKDTFKKVEIIEKRERVFEPSFRPGKGKRREKDRRPGWQKDRNYGSQGNQANHQDHREYHRWRNG